MKNFLKKMTEVTVESLVENVGWSVNNYLEQQKEFRSELAIKRVSEFETVRDLKAGHDGMLVHLRYADGLDHYIGHGLIAQAVRHVTQCYGVHLMKYGVEIKMAIDDDKGSVYLKIVDPEAFKVLSEKAAQEAMFQNRPRLN